MLRRNISAALVAAILGAVSYARAENAVVGVIGPYSGDSSYWGINSKRGLELALSDIAKERGAPVPLRTIFEDDRCDPMSAVTAFNKLVDVDGARVIVGPVCSTSSAAIAPLAKQKNVLLIVFSEADSIAGVGQNVLRLWIPNGRQGALLARHAYETRGLRRVAMLEIENAFGRDISQAFSETFTRLGGTVAAEETYAPDSRDLRAQLLRIKSKQPDGFFFASYIADGETVLRQAHDIGLSVPMFGPSTIDNPDFFKAVGGLAEGLTIADVQDVTDSPFRARWQRTFGEPWPGMQSGASLYYDLAHLLAEGTERLGDAGTLRVFLLQHAPYEGVSGTFKFDESGNLAKTHAVAEVHGGVPVFGAAK